MNDIKTTTELKKLAEAYLNECPYLNDVKKEMSEYEIAQYITNWNKWHEIDPTKSNYINFHQYRKIQDIIAMTVERLLRQSNDSLENHILFTLILQSTELEFTGPRFIRWLKKKLLPSKRLEIMRIVLDGKYFTDIGMDLFTEVPEKDWRDIIGVPLLQSLIKKLKKTK